MPKILATFVMEGKDATGASCKISARLQREDSGVLAVVHSTVVGPVTPAAGLEAMAALRNALLDPDNGAQLQISASLDVTANDPEFDGVPRPAVRPAPDAGPQLAPPGDAAELTGGSVCATCGQTDGAHLDGCAAAAS